MFTTIDLTEDQVEAVAIAEARPIRRMPQADAQQKLEQAKAHLDQAAHLMERATQIVQEEAKPLVDRAIAILVEIQNEQAWQELGYKSMRQLIQDKFEDPLNLSSSQIYRLVAAAQVRQQISLIDQNTFSIPNSHLEELAKLPSADERRDAWREINTTYQGKITSKQVRTVVENRRHKQEATQPLNYHSLAPTGDRRRPLQDFGQPEDNTATNSGAGQNSIATRHLKNYQIATIRDSDQFTPQQQEHAGCWGVVSHFLESSALVVVAGQTVEYFFEELEYITAPSPTLKEVCDRVTDLWQVPALPAFVQDFLKTYYQRRLDFAQENLDTLKLIESLLESLDWQRLSQQYHPIGMQKHVEKSSACNQIPDIISANS